MSVKLYVGNLSPDTTSEEICELFSNVGVVGLCRLMEDRETGRSRGFAFVEIDSEEAAQTAKAKLNGHELHGKTLKVNDAKPKIEWRNK